MYIGVPKEIKTREFRVGLTPSSVQELCQAGHQVYVETAAGVGIGCSDADYQKAGAEIVADAQAIFDKTELIVKVKEPQPQECRMLQAHHTLFTYLHLAADANQAKLLQASEAVAIAYETVTDAQQRLPLLAPMSEVAGRISIQLGAQYLEVGYGGKGVLLGGVPGVARAHVVIIGGGVVGTNALKMAIGMGARVTVLDRSMNRLRELDDLFGSKINTQYATQSATEQALKHADLVIGAVLVPGAAAPRVVTRDMLGLCEKGTVMVDVAIDQGGCFETSRPTTYDDPTYTVDGVIHYCVTNLPGAVPRTSAYALNHATLPFVFKLANFGTKKALESDPHLLNGLNVCRGHITYPAVAEFLQVDCMSPVEAVNGLK